MAPIEHNMHGQCVSFAIRPEIKAAALDILSDVILAFSAQNADSLDFMLGWGPIRLERSGGMTVVSEFDYSDRSWHTDITRSIINILGSDAMLRRLNVPSNPCIYSQAIAVESRALSDDRGHIQQGADPEQA